MDKVLEFVLSAVAFVVVLCLMVGITYLSVLVFYRIVGRIQNLVRYVKRKKKMKHIGIRLDTPMPITAGGEQVLTGCEIYGVRHDCEKCPQLTEMVEGAYTASECKNNTQYMNIVNRLEDEHNNENNFISV